MQALAGLDHPTGASARFGRPYTRRAVDPVLLALGVAVALASVVAVSSRDARVSTVGLVAALSVAPLIADPFPDPLAVAGRIVGGVLAVTLLRLAARPAPLTAGARIGWPAAALGAAAGFVAGLAAHGLVGEATGPAAAGAAAVAVGVLALAPSLDRRDVLRLATGLLLVLTAADLLRAATLGSPDGLAELIAGVAMAAVGAAGAALLAAGAEDDSGVVGRSRP